MDGDFLHLATALDPQWKDLKESSREGCLRKMRAALDLLKGEEGVARDKVDAPKPKKDCLTSTNLTMIVMERARLMSSPFFEILTFANEFLYCCIKYQNEPFRG